MYIFMALSRSIGREHSKISTPIHKLSRMSFVAASQQTDACTPNQWHPQYQSRRTLILEPLGSEYSSFKNLTAPTLFGSRGLLCGADLKLLPIPTIAAVEGAALGGGLELALACDFRICGEDAVLGLPETGHAIIPGAGATRRLPRLINKAIAKDLVLTGRRVGGREAESLGPANYCVPAGEAYSKALEVARIINDKGPKAIRAGKRAIEEGLLVSQTEEAADLEEECYEMTLDTKDRLEGLAASVEKRKPLYKGR